MIDNTSVVIEFVKSFAIITRKEAGDGPYLKKKVDLNGRKWLPSKAGCKSNSGLLV